MVMYEVRQRPASAAEHSSGRIPKRHAEPQPTSLIPPVLWEVQASPVKPSPNFKGNIQKAPSSVDKHKLHFYEATGYYPVRLAWRTPLRMTMQPKSAALIRPTNPTPDVPACDPTVLTPAPWTISRITHSSLEEASSFINASRRELFPSLGHDTLLDDPAILETSHVLVARDTADRMIAAIAYVPFDYRFPHLPPPVGQESMPSSTANSSSSSLNLPVPSSQPYCKVVEVVRLFVVPQYRRYGLAAALFQSLQEHALASAVQCMYLHTHPFLPGAIRFWNKQGFEIIGIDHEDKVWLTHHFCKILD